MSNTPVVQTGVVTPGHVASFTTDGVIQDAGNAAVGALTSVGITNNGGLALGVSSGNPPGEYTQFGVSASSNGTITLSGNTYGGGPPAVINFEVNGTSIPVGQQFPIGPHELLGNPGTGSASPTGIAVGVNLTLTADGTLNATAVSGTTTTVVAVAPLTGGTITTSGTIGFETIAATSLFGNPAGSAGTLQAIAIGPGLSLNSAGTLELGVIAADSLFGNSGTVNAVGTNIAVGSGLTLASGTLSVNGGGVQTIVAGSGLAGGTITNAGTVSLGMLGAGVLFGNPGTVGAVGTNVAIGTNLTLATNGTLSATGVTFSGVIGIQAFTTTSTYTPTSGMKSVVAQLWGGGGGGANFDSNGGGGGQTSLGSLVVAKGGSGGSDGGTGGAGGTGGTGTVGIPGTNGAAGSSLLFGVPAFNPNFGTGGMGDGTGGNGGGGEFRMSFVSAASIGASQVVTIGAAGTAGNAPGIHGYMLIYEYG